MFAASSKNVVFRPEDGMSVLVEGYLTVYEQSGQYQIYCKSMTEDGLGNLHVAYEQLKKKLEQEGLFDQRHKKAIPRFPKSIGVLTSPTGAAVKDIINIVNRRFPLTNIIIYPTLVQGEFAKADIVKNIQKANQDKLVDVIILGRGGGSIEDLWPFNEEVVAYEIFNSDIPIISSVGHETDFTISDFVADLRAPTPSGGAEIAVPDQLELHQYIKRLENAMSLGINRTIKVKQDRLHRLKDHYIFRDPGRITEQKSRKLDFLMEKLEILKPHNKVNQSKKNLQTQLEKLQYVYKNILRQKENQFTLKVNKLELLNPLSIMTKGYSVTKKDNVIIKSIAQEKETDKVSIDLKDGTFDAVVTNVRKGE